MKYTIKELIDKSFYTIDIVRKYKDKFTDDDIKYLIDKDKNHSDFWFKAMFKDKFTPELQKYYDKKNPPSEYA